MSPLKGRVLVWGHPAGSPRLLAPQRLLLAALAFSPSPSGCRPGKPADGAKEQALRTLSRGT